MTLCPAHAPLAAASDVYKRQARGYVNNMPHLPIPDGEILMPLWFGDEAFHSSHRRKLLSKDYEFYGEFGWREDDGSAQCEYVWPTGESEGGD